MTQTKLKTLSSIKRIKRLRMQMATGKLSFSEYHVRLLEFYKEG